MGDLEDHAAQHPVTLAFTDRALETVYERQQADRRRSAWRRAYRNCALVWLLFAAVDPIAAPAASRTLILLRLTVAVPALVAGSLFGYARTDLFVRRSQLVGACTFALPGLVAVSLPAWLPGTALYAGFFMVLMQSFIHSAFMLRFVYASALGWLLFVAFAASVAVGPPTDHVLIANTISWGVLGAIVGMLISRSFEQFRRRDFLKKRQLEEQRAQSDRLLRNILPDTIAERLKRGEQPIADRFEAVTVLFADIANFTPLAEKLSPERLVELLNRIFSTFDRITERHGLEKIKTIGDAYMVVGGAPSRRADHARAVAELALELRAAVAELAVGPLEGLAVRIGMHSGPVIAGVIGHRKFSYDLWGDTVNTASRMESHGLPARIQISTATAELLRADYVLEARGEIDLKGKGRVAAWLLESRRA